MKAVLILLSLAAVFTALATPAHALEAMECPDVAPVAPSIAHMDPDLRESLEHAHQISTGQGITVAIIDTGVSPHPRLPHLIPGGDFVGAHQAEGLPGELIDCDGHGTIVAGIIATRPDPGSGWPYDGTGDTHLGVAPGVGLIAIKQTSAFVRTSGDSSIGTLGSLAESIHRAIDMGAHIINISVVSCIPASHAQEQAFTPLHDALMRAEYEGIVVVAAAGNLGQDCPLGSTVHPAHSDTVLAVSARFDSHTIATYSVPSAQQLLSAPGRINAGLSPRGEGFISAMTTPSGNSPFEGTSFAAPVVSATAALIRQRHPHASPHEIRERILESIDPARGAVDPFAALTHEPTPLSAEIHEVTVHAPLPADNSASNRAMLILAGLAILIVMVSVIAGWWRSRI